MNQDKEIRTMIHKDTMEEKAYQSLLDQKLETLSEAAHSIIWEALTEAYKRYLVPPYCYGSKEYVEAMGKMRLAATRITRQERKILGEIVQAGLLAAASIDPEDRTLVGHKVDRGDLHWYYKMSSGMVDEVLQEVPEPKQQDKGNAPMKNSNKCAGCRDIVECNEELERDIRTLQSMLRATDDYFEEIYERHRDSPGWDFVHSHLGRAVGNPEELLKVLPENKEQRFQVSEG